MLTFIGAVLAILLVAFLAGVGGAFPHLITMDRTGVAEGLPHPALVAFRNWFLFTVVLLSGAAIVGAIF